MTYTIKCQCDGGFPRGTYHVHSLTAPRPCSARSATIPAHRATLLVVGPYNSSREYRCEDHAPRAPIATSLADPDLDELIERG